MVHSGYEGKKRGIAMEWLYPGVLRTFKMDIILPKHMLEYNTGSGIRGSQYYFTEHIFHTRDERLSIDRQPAGTKASIGGQKYGGEISSIVV